MEKREWNKQKESDAAKPMRRVVRWRWLFSLWPVRRWEEETTLPWKKREFGWNGYTHKPGSFRESTTCLVKLA